MVLNEPGSQLRLEDRAIPPYAAEQVLIKVEACAICRTDLHVQDAELPDLTYPIVPGHQAIGEVVAAGAQAELDVGSRVGVAWLAWTCGTCAYCRSDCENLCDRALFHGYQRDGGFADFMVANARFCFALPGALPAAEATPLLCGGLIGYRALRMAEDAQRIAIYGFGSAAHLITQVALHQGREIFAFTRPGDACAQQFARELGASWAGDSDQAPPGLVDAALIFAPAGELVPQALRSVRKGGRVICAGIHMSDIPSFPYVDLWGERMVRSVANMTRADGEEFLRVATEASIRPRIETYQLEDANRGMTDLRNGRLSGTAVLLVS